MTATCPRCGRTWECDDREDATLTLRNHWDAAHVTDDLGHNPNHPAWETRYAFDPTDV